MPTTYEQLEKESGVSDIVERLRNSEELSAGIYPMALRGAGEQDYEVRTEFMEGWNAAVCEIEKNFDAICAEAANEIESLRQRVAELERSIEYFKTVRDELVCANGELAAPTPKNKFEYTEEFSRALWLQDDTAPKPEEPSNER